jgi:Helix-turn-helix domain
MTVVASLYWTAGKKGELLRAARKLGVAPACRQFDVSRESYYRWRRAFEAKGRAGLRPVSRRGVSLPTLRVDPEREATVLELTSWMPEMSKHRVAQQAGLSATAVRNVWLRRGVGTNRQARIAWAARRRGGRPAEWLLETWLWTHCSSCRKPFRVKGRPPFTCPRCREVSR